MPTSVAYRSRPQRRSWFRGYRGVLTTSKDLDSKLKYEWDFSEELDSDESLFSHVWSDLGVTISGDSVSGKVLTSVVTGAGQGTVTLTTSRPVTGLLTKADTADEGVTGVGTAFTTELAVGDTIYVNDTELVVNQIVNDTLMGVADPSELYSFTSKTAVLLNSEQLVRTYRWRANDPTSEDYR